MAGEQTGRWISQGSFAAQQVNKNAADDGNDNIRRQRKERTSLVEELCRRWFADYSSNSRMSRDTSTKVTII